MKKFVCLFLIIALNLLFIPTPNVKACVEGEECGGGSGGIGTGGVIGIALGTLGLLGLVGLYVLHNHKSNPKLSTWSQIISFNIDSLFDESEIKELISKQPQKDNLLCYAMSFISPKQNQTVSNEKPVLFKQDFKKTNLISNNKLFVIGETEIKNDTLHLYHVKLPEEILKQPDKLVARATLVYKTDNKNENIVYHMYNDIKTDKIDKIIGSKQLKETVKFQEVSNISVEQKEFKINKSDIALSLTFKNPVKNQKDIISGSYAILISINKS